MADDKIWNRLPQQKLEQAIGDDIINQREVKEMYMNTK